MTPEWVVYERTDAGRGPELGRVTAADPRDARQWAQKNWGAKNAIVALVRGFWKVPADVFDATNEEGSSVRPPDLVELDRTGANVWCLSALHPRPDLDDLGGTFLGHRLSELAPADFNRLARTLVERDLPPQAGEPAGGGRMLVQPNAVNPTDTVIETDIPGTIFLGDAVADYQ